MFSPTQLKSFLETLIFVAEKPLKVSEMLKAIEAYSKKLAKETSAEENSTQSAEEQLEQMASQEEAELGASDIKGLLKELAEFYESTQDRGFRLVEVAGGWQFRTKPANLALIQAFKEPKPTKLSRPAMETLAIVAYRQPITRAEVDEIRGVDSGGVLKTLLEKNLLRLVGKKDEPGKPVLYGTAQEFLELFELKNLKDLPGLRDFSELEEEFRRQAADQGVVVENEEATSDQDKTLDELSEAYSLETLDPEDEAMLQDLDSNIKEVRGLEKEIFAEEKSEETQEKQSEDKVSLA